MMDLSATTDLAAAAREGRGWERGGGGDFKGNNDEFCIENDEFCVKNDEFCQGSKGEDEAGAADGIPAEHGNGVCFTGIDVLFSCVLH